jgi:D-glycero-D-manno-heptose 1,7-bisphosphate phosphatase
VIPRRAIFLDRDGVINAVVVRGGSPASPRSLEEFNILPGVPEALLDLRRFGFLNIVVTNQPDVARGLLDQPALEAMHQQLREVLAIDDIFLCPHDDRHACSCRKPKAGMLFDAARKWNLDLSRSLLVGDTEKDMVAAGRAGCTRILVDRPYNAEVEADFRVATLAELVELAGRPGVMPG